MQNELDDTTPGHIEGPAHARREKERLRRHVLTARDDVSGDEHERLSRAVCERAMGLPELKAAGTLMLFASIGSEIDTTPLLAWALARGVRVCLPRILTRRVMEAYEITDPATDLEPGTWDIPEPREDLPRVPPEEIDVVVVPGALFDEGGGRCGYGGGFYDNFLPGTRDDAVRISLALELQLVDDVPCEPHDLGIHIVVTEERVIRPD